MTGPKLKMAFMIVFAVLLVGLLMGAVAAGRGDLDPKTFLVSWTAACGVFTLAYAACSVYGKLD